MTSEFIVIDGRRRLCKIELAHRRGGHHVHMAVGDLVSSDDQPHALWMKHGSLGMGNSLGYEEEVARLAVLEIGPLVDFPDRYDESVSRCQRVD